MNEDVLHELDVFLHGELVDLGIPTREFVNYSNWYKWFNDENLVKYLEQGVYPNTKSKQIEFFESLAEDRLVLIMLDKQRIPVGIISLSFINHNKKSCDIALVVSNDGDRKLMPFISLEAMALLTSHAFTKLGMQRIGAGQHIGLAGWQSRLELLGYQLEGLHIGKFVKGSEVADSMSIAASKMTYDYIVTNRGGCLWDSYSEMRRRVKAMPKKTYSDMLIKFYETERKNYYSDIFSL